MFLPFQKFFMKFLLNLLALRTHQKFSGKKKRFPNLTFENVGSGVLCVLVFPDGSFIFIEKDQHKSKPQNCLEAIEKNRNTLEMTGSLMCNTMK